MQNNRDIFWNDLNKTTQGNLEGKVAVITGGGKGIGRAIAENFLDNGAMVVIISRASGKDLAAAKSNCYHYVCDVRDFKNVSRTIDKVARQHGNIDILVNAAGVALLTPLKDESEKLFDLIMDTNFKGVRNCVVAAADYLEKSRGCIINIGSIWGMAGINLVGDATYSAADAAIIKYTEILAEELPAVRANCISPALVDTAMNDDMTVAEKQEFVRAYENRDSLLQPSEIAEVAEFIAKGALNQKTVIIDAGYIKRTRA